MPKNDLTTRIMKKVVSFEKKRTTSWLARFGISLAMMMLIALIFFAAAVNQIFEAKTYELLTLFGQDLETIRENWADTVGAIWEEFPRGDMAIFLFTLILAIFVIGFFRNKFGIMKKRFSNILKLQKTLPRQGK